MKAMVLVLSLVVTSAASADIIRLDSTNFVNSNLSVTSIGKKSLAACPGFSIDSDGQITDGSGTFNLISSYAVEIATTSGKYTLPTICAAPNTPPDIMNYLVILKEGGIERDSQCEISRTCDSSNNCTSVYGQRQRQMTLDLVTNGNSTVVTDWTAAGGAWSPCK